MLSFIKRFSLVGFSVILRLLRMTPFPRLIGPMTFSAAVAPVVGFFGRPASCFFLFACRTGLAFLTNVQILGFFTHIPTLAGSLVLSSHSRLLKVAIPLLCIATFLGHPVGLASWRYTLYWLVPLGLGLLPIQNIFLRSLASTLTTHAVGSTLFLYTHPTTTLYWHTLIAQVWIERLVYALILTSSYYVVNFTIQWFNRWKNQFHFESRLCQDLLPSF